MSMKQNIIFLIGGLVLALIVSACSKSKDNRWIKTEEGVEYFLPEDKEPSLFTFGKYYWTGDNVDGLAYGNGELRFEDTWSSKNNYSIKGFAHFGAILPGNKENFYIVGSLKNNVLEGFGSRTINDTTIIGNFKKGEVQGEGKVYTHKELIYSGKLKNSIPDGQGELYENGQLIYNGNFKLGEFNGKGELFYPNGQLHYSGKFKKGIFHGKGTLYFPTGDIFYKGGFHDGLFDGKGEINYPLSIQDSIPYSPTDQTWLVELNNSPTLKNDSVALSEYLKARNLSEWINEKHVFEKGDVQPLHKQYFDNLNDKIPELDKSTYVKIYQRINNWETNAWWKYLIIIGVLAILWFILLGVYYEEEIEDYDGNVRKNVKLYSKIIKWSYWRIYPIWLLFGWFGFHRAVLKSISCIVYGGLFTFLVLINLRNIVLFLFWPSSWQFMEISTLSIFIAGIIVLFLFVDIFWIPWRCYWLNHTFYRHDLRENELISNKSTDLDHLVKDIKPKLNDTIKELSISIERTKQIQNKKYEGSTSSFNLKRMVSVTFGNDKWADFEMARLQSLEKELKHYTKVQNNFSDLAVSLNQYLEEARQTAYRNINLAKELIRWIRKANSKETVLEKDRELHAVYSNFDFSVIRMPDIELGVDFDSACKQCVKTTNLLMSVGLRLGPSLAIGAALSLISHIADALQKAQRLCEEANEKSRLAVKGIGESLQNIVESEADILRAYEILSSLNEANKAFLNIYVPLRDIYFGSSPSFGYFIRGGVKIPARNYRDDFIHLQQVTSEYNNINKSKL